VFETIASEPERLQEVPGIDPLRVASIVKGWAEQKAVDEIMFFPHGHPVSTAPAVPLTHRVLKAVPASAALLLVGDVDQLPSIGPKQVLADIIASGAVLLVRLVDVFRQATRSRIVVTAGGNPTSASVYRAGSATSPAPPRQPRRRLPFRG
jgi:hypothetical protein